MQMTAGTHPSSPALDYTSPHVEIDVSRPAPAEREAVRVWAITMAVIVAMYLLLVNPYWVPGGDSELYLAAGRSLALGQGYRFNGQHVNISPPGWPLVLAGVMKIHPTFAAIKLVTLFCMAGALSLWYWLLLRFTAPRVAAIVTLATAVTSHVYSLSFWAHSDALFCLLALGAMVVACQINEGRSNLRLRVVALLALCAAATFVRWAAVLQWLLIAGLLLTGYELPVTRARLKAWLAWVRTKSPPAHAPPAVILLAVVLSGVVTLGTMLVVRQALKLTAAQEIEARDAGVSFDDAQTQAQQPAPEHKAPDLLNTAPLGRRSLPVEMWVRFMRAGRWIAWLTWPEMRFVGSAKIKYVPSLDTIVGWLILLLLVAASVHGVRHRQWVWAGLIVYCLAMFLNWPNPNARYLVPVAPLILWGVMRGIFEIGKGRTWGKIHRGALVAFVASVFLANAVLYGVDLWVARSGDRFYDRYEGGTHQALLAIGKYVAGQNIRSKSIAVSEEYINLGNRRVSKYGLRALVMLTDLRIRPVPQRYCEDPRESPKAVRWLRDNKVHWYVFQDEVSPWRVWHFRVPTWLQEKLSKDPVKPPTEGWELFHRVEGEWEKLDVPRVTSADFPTRVPGL